ncbi:MAG: hypothetical protein INF52_14740 [Rhodobacter sp.]|nr:hypothetical protein [Rhodobacter sp.]
MTGIESIIRSALGASFRSFSTEQVEKEDAEQVCRIRVVYDASAGKLDVQKLLEVTDILSRSGELKNTAPVVSFVSLEDSDNGGMIAAE